MMILNLESLGVTPSDVALSKGGVAVEASTGASPPGLFAAIVAGQSELMKLANTGDVEVENTEAALVTEESLADVVAELNPEGDGAEGEESALFAAFGVAPEAPPGVGVRGHAHLLLQGDVSANSELATKPVSTATVTQLPSPHGPAAGEAVAAKGAIAIDGADPPVESTPLESRTTVTTLPSRAAPQAVDATQAAMTKPAVTPGLEHVQASEVSDGPEAATARVVRVDAANVTVEEGAEPTPRFDVATDAQSRATRAQQSLKQAQPQTQTQYDLGETEMHKHAARPALRVESTESAATARIATNTEQAVAVNGVGQADVGQQQGQSANGGNSGGQTPTSLPSVAPLSGGARSFEAAMADGAPMKSESASATLETIAPRTVQSVRMMVQQGATTMRMRLVPAHLGELHIVVESGSNGVQIDLSSANREVRESLEGQLVALRDQLARDGVEVNRINVTADSSGAAQSGSSTHRQTPQFDGAQRNGTFNQRETNHQNGDPPPERRQRDHAPSAGSQSLNVYA